LDYALKSQHVDCITLLRLLRLAKEDKTEDYSSILMEVLNEIQINFALCSSKSISDEDTISDDSEDTVSTQSRQKKVPKVPKLSNIPTNRISESPRLLKYSDILTPLSSVSSEFSLLDSNHRSNHPTILETVPDSESPQISSRSQPSGNIPVVHSMNDIAAFSMSSNESTPQRHHILTQDKKKTSRRDKTLLTPKGILRHATSHISKSPTTINNNGRKDK